VPAAQPAALTRVAAIPALPVPAAKYAVVPKTHAGAAAGVKLRFPDYFSPPLWLSLRGGSLDRSRNPFLPFPKEGIARARAFLDRVFQFPPLGGVRLVCAMAGRGLYVRQINQFIKLRSRSAPAE